MAEGEDQFLQIVFWLSYTYCGTHTPIHKQVNKCNKTRWYWYLPKITKMKGQMVPAIGQVWWHTPVIQHQDIWRLAPSSRPSSDFKFSLASWDFVSIYIPYIYHTHIYVCVMLEWIWSNFLLMLNGVWNINTCPVEHRNNSINSCELDEEGFAIYKTSFYLTQRLNSWICLTKLHLWCSVEWHMAFIPALGCRGRWISMSVRTASFT